jgi:hypothetical protein
MQGQKAFEGFSYLGIWTWYSLHRSSDIETQSAAVPVFGSKKNRSGICF